MKIYCINLARSKERRMKMSSQFERLAMPVEFISAVDGRELTDSQVSAIYSKWRTRLCHGRDLTRGEIGCTLSHMDFYRMVSERNESGFVFEDDVELTADIIVALERVDSFLKASKEPCLVQLPGLNRDFPKSNNIGSDDAFVKVLSAMGAYAYGLNPEAAILLLRAFTPIRFPVDDYGYLVKHWGLNLYVYNRKVVSVDIVGESTVGEERFKSYKGAGLLFYKVWRLVGKTIDIFFGMRI